MTYSMFFYDAAAASGPAERVYVAACEGYSVPAGLSRRVAAFARRVFAEVPEVLDTEYEDASADARGNYFMLHVPMGADPQLVGRIERIAAECGLSAYDPQTMEEEEDEDWISDDLSELPPADPERAPRRTYIILFFDATTASGDGRALFRDVSRNRMEAAGKSPRVARFVARAFKEHPELDDMVYEDLSSSWRGGNYFLIHLPFPDGGTYLGPLTALARRFGLTAYDPQDDPEAGQYLEAWR